jgi:hypothetical protein
MPGRLVQLHRAGDRVTEEECPVEQVAVALGCGVVTEVARTGDEGTVGDGAEDMEGQVVR